MKENTKLVKSDMAGVIRKMKHEPGNDLVIMGMVQAGLTLLLLTAGAVPVLGQGFVAEARRVPVASLDSTLPAVPFEEWLADLGGVAVSAIKWEINDCGEGGDGREAPTCVEAILGLAGDTTAHASLVVTGIDGKRVKLAIWDLSVGAGYSFTGFKTLRAWAAYLRTRHR